MQISHRTRVLAQALPVDDPCAYPELIGKIYDPPVVRARFDQIFEDVEMSPETLKAALHFYASMVHHDLTCNKMLAKRLYFFEHAEAAVGA